MQTKPFLLALFALALCLSSGASVAADPLPSWNDGNSKKAIVDFVGRVSKKGGADYVPPEDRIAVFDNDGTLWAEQPMYVQLAFVLDRVKALAPKHPEWKKHQPFKAALEGDMATLAKSGEKGLMELLMATHAGMSNSDFGKIAEDWLRTAKHPKTGKPYTEMVYQPMLELLQYLRDNGFKTFIVSGGGVEFMRPWAEKVYGVPPEQVIGSAIELKYEVVNGTPTLTRQPKVHFIDDKAGKPVGIQRFIGHRPIAAFGNSDGDFQMLEWVRAGKGASLGAIVHHTDGKREFAYDRKSPFGRLDRGLDEAPKRGWILIDMKSDWVCVFQFQCKAER